MSSTPPTRQARPRRATAALPGIPLDEPPPAPPPAASPRSRREMQLPPAASVFLLYAAAALLVTIGTWGSSGTAWVGGCCDPEQTIWFLRWVPYALSHLDNPFFTHQLNAPAGVNLMWNTPLVFLGFIASPITLLLGPVVSYNILVTLSIAFGAWCMFLVLRRYVRGLAGAIVGGAVYGFSPYVIPQADAHLDLAFAVVPPLVLLVLDELLVRRRHSPLRLGVALGLLAFAQFLTAEEIVLTATLIGLVMLGVLRRNHRAEFRAARRRVFEALRAALITFAVLAIFPLAVQFFGPQQVHGALHAPDVFSTDLVNLLVPTKFQLFSPVAATTLSSHFSGLDFEANAFIGLILLIVLVAFVARHWHDVRVRTAAIVGSVALVFSLGPHLVIGGQATSIPLPMIILDKLPLVGYVQPNRLTLYMWIAIAVIAAVAIDDALLPGRWRHSVPRVGAIAIGLLAAVPAALPSWTTQIPAFFQNWQQSGIADGTTILVAPFFRDGAGADPMLWAGVAGEGFRMPEAYAYVPQADGTPGYGPPATQLSSVMEKIQDTGVTIVVRGAARTRVAADLRAASVRDVVVGPMQQRTQMVAFFSDLFGRPPEQVGGVQLWRDVDRNGVSARSTSGTDKA